jgi:hypothetical protein
MYRLSRAVLLAHEDKVFQGALVFDEHSVGPKRKATETGRLPLVWTRDLVHSATALLATGQMARGAPCRPRHADPMVVFRRTVGSTGKLIGLAFSLIK